MTHLDTDIIRKTPDLRSRFYDQLTRTDDGCLLYPHTTITVSVRGFRYAKATSPARVAWALAHPLDHLGPRDLAVHICKFGTNHANGDMRVCCEPSHLKKGHLDDVVHMKQTRKRQLVLQGAV